MDPTWYSCSSVTRFVWTRKNTQWGGEPLLIPFHWFRRTSGAAAKSVRRLRKFRSDMWSSLCRANDSWQSNSHSTTGAGSVSNGFSYTSSCERTQLWNMGQVREKGKAKPRDLQLKTDRHRQAVAPFLPTTLLVPLSNRDHYTHSVPKLLPECVHPNGSATCSKFKVTRI